jgi:hypothetical protein
MGHDQVDLRLLYRALLEVRPEESAAVPSKGRLRPPNNTFVPWVDAARHQIQHCLEEPGESLGNGTILNDEAI